MSVVVLHPVAAPAAATVLGAGDPGSSRLVYAMVIGLALVGVAFIALAVWIIRQTRTDLEVLAPLERMGDGDWRKRDPSTQRRMLDEVRPEGARPLLSEPPPPPFDVDFEADHPVTSFNDLGPGVVSEGGDPTPVEVDADQFRGVVPPGGEEEDSIADGPEAEEPIAGGPDADRSDADEAPADARPLEERSETVVDDDGDEQSIDDEQSTDEVSVEQR